MSVTTPIPPPLREWAQAIVGPVSERNVSHNRPNSLVWELTYDTGWAFAKLSPNPMSFARETRALREVAPGLEPGTVPLLRGADVHQQALLLSLVPGRHERARPHAAVADVVLLTCGPWVGRLDLEQAFWNGYGRGLTAEEERALRCLSALDAASAISWGVPNGDHEIVERGRATLARLEVLAA